jgi:DNA mismatch repair protein MutS
LAFTDVTTGQFRFTQLSDYFSFVEEMSRIGPREIIYPEEDASLAERLGRDFSSVHFSPVAAFSFSQTARERLKSLRLWAGGDEEEWGQGVRAAAAVVSFLEQNLPDVLKALCSAQPYWSAHYLLLDESTRSNLELLTNLQGERKGSLLGVLDYTSTPMGARGLRQWILYPLLDEKAILQRQEGIEDLVDNYQGRQDLLSALKNVQDLERLAGRVPSGHASPRDLVAVKETLRALVPIREKLLERNADIFSLIREDLCELPEVVEMIEGAIVDAPPVSLKEGGVIRAGFQSELDELRGIRSNAKGWIGQLESDERKRTGINSLKVRYNRVFGYYIEVTNANIKMVPDNYLRKQTLVNGERFITPELKEYEARVLGSEEEIIKLEQTLFDQVRDGLSVHYAKMKQSSLALANLDVLLSLSEAAQSLHLVRPKVDSGRAISIREGRHPVVEAMLGRGVFVPNDCYLDPQSDQILILTGPNMAGKSTYMRQVALIVIMAQMGSFVPAAAAHIGLVDRLFTRIGAADSLARGESTFMVEMRETSHILRDTSPRSLILLDEVGRGTSTFDGISIAWSVGEYLHDSSDQPRTLFATHYHELTDLALTKERVKNFTFAVKEWKGDVIFLRNLVEGASSRSYGIHVAGLAGLPSSVVGRAKEILKNLEGGELDERGRPRLAGSSRSEDPAQMMLFTSTDHRIRKELEQVDISTLTPIEALNLLHRLVEEAREEGEVSSEEHRP